VKRGKIVAVMLLCLTLVAAVACSPFRNSGESGQEFTGELVDYR